jgi:PTH1 family peptidyl-tRNA hydrolase
VPPRVEQLVVGLGNPGLAYRDTRHNIGHHVLDVLAGRLGGRFHPRGLALVAEAEHAGRRVALAKPLGFMNTVGPPVARLLATLGLEPAALILVQDDLDLGFGQVRVRLRGSHGGHNGVRSLVEALGTTEIRRVKVGIGRPAGRDEVVDWVLTGFDAEERAGLAPVVDRAADRVLELVAAWTDRPRRDIN